MVPSNPTDEVSLPALLRAARRTYGTAIRAALDDAGLADLPREGPFVIGALLRIGPQLGRIIAALGVSKQAAGQLIDALVQRGYLERDPDPDDRRRFVLALTPRGRTAARALRSAIARVDAELERRVGAPDMRCTRRTLQALAQMASPEPAQED